MGSTSTVDTLNRPGEKGTSIRFVKHAECICKLINPFVLFTPSGVHALHELFSAHLPEEKQTCTK